MNTFIVDIDFTLLFTPFDGQTWDYTKSSPYWKTINKVNALYDAGHKIILFTARGMGSRNGDIEIIEKECRPIIEEWLKNHNVKYHQLIMGKPWGPGKLYYIDDKNLTINQFLSDEDFEDCLCKNKDLINE